MSLGKGRILHEKRRGSGTLSKAILLESQLEGSPDGILIADDKGKIVLFNRRFVELWGISSDVLDTNDTGELLRHVLGQLKKPEIFFDKVRERYTKRKDEEGGEEIEFKDGRIVERYSRSLVDSRGGYYGRIWYFRDITARKLARQRLESTCDELENCVERRTADLIRINEELRSEINERRRAEEVLGEERNLLRTLIDNMPDHIYIKDVESRLRICNMAVVRAVGAQRLEDVIGKSDFDFAPRDLAAEYYADEQEIIKSGKPMVNKEEMLENQPGNKICLLTTKVPVRDSQGNVVGIVGIGRDISERKQIEESLRESEALYQSLVDVLPQRIYRTDCGGRLTFGNKAYLEELGISLEQCLGKTAYDFFPRELADKYTADDRYVIETGETFSTVEGHRVPATGEMLYVQVVKAPVRDPEGKIIGVEGIFWDITEQKKAEEKLFVYQRQLQSLASELSLAEERLRRRIATEVHDHVGQNLAISKMKIESLLELRTGPEFSESLKEVRDLLMQTIKSTRSLTFELSPPVLYDLGFEAAVEWLIRHTRERYGLCIEFRSNGRAKPLDSNLRVILFQAVRELLVNVAKHAHANNVKVSTRRVGDEIQVKVEDDGIGFEVFEKGSNDYETGGFGLFSIRERLGYVGGRLEVKSRPGYGTCITLAAPINQEYKKK